MESIKEIYPDTSIEDINRLFYNTTIQINNDLFIVERIDEEETLFLGRYPETGNSATIMYEDIYSIDISYPDTGFFNITSNNKHFCLYTNRIPRRQWKVGLSFGSNTEVIVPFNLELSRKNIILPHDEVISTFIFNRHYLPYSDMAAAIDNRSRLSLAINKYIAIGKSLYYDYPIILYKNRVVGFMDGDTVHITSLADYIVNDIIMPKEMQANVKFI